MPLKPQNLAINMQIKQEENGRAVITAAEKSLKHYQRTGLHTTLEELKDWAHAVRRSRTEKMPACHM